MLAFFGSVKRDSPMRKTRGLRQTGTLEARRVAGVGAESAGFGLIPKGPRKRLPGAPLRKKA